MDGSKRKVIVVSKHALLREGLRRMLASSTDILLLGAVQTLKEAKALTAETPPDVIITDRDDPLEQEQLTNLMEMTNSKVVTITAEDRDLIIYTRKLVPDASVQNLFDVLKNSQ